MEQTTQAHTPYAGTDRRISREEFDAAAEQERRIAAIELAYAQRDPWSRHDRECLIGALS